VTQFTSDTFRHVLGHLPTGVTVLTAFADGAPTGMAANSVTSVSLEPPLILVCPAKTSSTWPAIRAAGCFCVNVMAGHHAELCRQFALKNVDRFAGVDWDELPTGPALTDAVAWIECEISHEHDAGDHAIVVASVVGLRAAVSADPLVFFRGGYGSFTAAEAYRSRR
jgi:3-hydroxy-9,10-secoandrosta-1,3,5(10)-triene-9,17-dione monooxygenase reductase component